MKRKIRPIPTAKTLTEQQKFLLEAIPRQFDMQKLEIKDTREVARARMIVARFDKRAGIQQCKHQKRMDALRQKARESVYFDDIEKARAIVRQCRKFLAGCPL